MTVKKLIEDRLRELNQIITTTSDLQKGFEANEEAIKLTKELIELEKCGEKKYAK